MEIKDISEARLTLVQLDDTLKWAEKKMEKGEDLKGLDLTDMINSLQAMGKNDPTSW